ncbi:TPA: hypothetical protein ACSRV8_000861 [Enterobacter hormaechei subsp. steigerwaltii]
MSTITKESIADTIEGLEHLANRGIQSVYIDMAIAGMRRLLASLEAEPVCVIDQSNLDYLNSGSDADVWPASRTEMGDVLLYRAAPPAPASVPDCFLNAVSALESMYRNGQKQNWNERYTTDMAYASGALRACRDAMLQGAEPVTTDYKLPFEQWLSQQTGTIDVECGCVMTEVFFHWLRVAYEAGNSPVIPDGYCIMPLKLTADNGAKGALCGEFHVQYRIVCQSCVGEGCEDCNHTGGWDAEIPVSWDTIKRIHESAVEACALPAAPQQEVK